MDSVADHRGPDHRAPDDRAPDPVRTIGRRAFLVGGGALVVAGCGPRGDADDAAPGPSTTTTTAPTTTTTDAPTTSGPGAAHPLALRGVNFDTERTVWRSEYVQREMVAIHDDLHANAVILLGSDLDRLVESARHAADLGLHVWFEPRQFDADAAGTIEFLTATARAAEALRAEHPDVGLSLGVELTIFMAGLLPGADWLERATALGTTDPGVFNAGLDEFLATALAAVRPVYGGPVTYSSGVWEDVDWTGFDVVGIDLYRDADNEATFVDDVRALHAHGKPVVITEFGCCSFRGAERLGGTGFLQVDWWADPPMVAAGTVRDEQVQARYLEELLDVFEAEGVHGAFVYDFIEPDNPWSADPRFDFDMAGFGVVRCYGPDHELGYACTGHFDPKAGFRALARRFA